MNMKLFSFLLQESACVYDFRYVAKLLGFSGYNHKYWSYRMAQNFRSTKLS